MVSKKAGQRAIIGAEYSVSRTPAPPSVSHARRAAGVWLLLSYRATGTGEEGRQQGKHRRQVKKKLRLPNVSFFNYEVLSNSFSNEAGHRTDFSSILYLSVSWMFLIYLRVASAGLSAFQVFARQENKHSTLSAAHRSVCTSTPHLRLQSSVGTAADTVATNGVVYSISIRRLIPDVWSHWPGCQIKAFVLKRSLLKKKKNATQFHKKKNRCGALSCLSCALWKQSVEGEVSKQAGAPPPDVSYPDAPASGASLPRPKPVMTHQQRGAREGDGPLSLLKPPRSALKPNLFQTQRQPKGDQNQNQRAIFFFCRGRILSSTPCFPHAAAAAEQGREQKTAFNTEPWGATPAIRE